MLLRKAVAGDLPALVDVQETGARLALGHIFPQELIEHLAAAGKPSARLRVFEQNHRARRFYQKLGWQPTTRLTRSAFAPYPTLIEYEIDL